MMATKTTSSDRSDKAPLSGGDIAKKSVPNYLKPTACSPIKAHSGRATHEIKKSSKPASPSSRPGSSSSLSSNGKASQTVKTTSPVSKGKKLTGPMPVKKKESSIKTAAFPPQVTATKRHVLQKSQSNCRKAVQALCKLKNVIDEGKHIEQQKHRAFKDPTVAVRKATPVTIKKEDAPRNNDVIEETMANLMGTKKNNVLALVGAFEMFMSVKEPNGRQAHKANHAQPWQRVQQALAEVQRSEKQKNEGVIEAQKRQEVLDAQKEQKDRNTLLNEVGNQALEICEEKEDAVIKIVEEKAEPDEAFSHGELGEDAIMVKEEEEEEKEEEEEEEEEEEVDKALLKNSNTGEEELTESMNAVID